MTGSEKNAVAGGTIAKTDSFVESVVDGEVVLMDIDDGRFFSLDATSRRIWELLDEHQSASLICEKLLEEYEVGADQCNAAIERLIDKLVDHKMVEIQQ